MLTAVVGINWGDEGKGRMVDLLSEKFDIVMRYQGGNIIHSTGYARIPHAAYSVKDYSKNLPLLGQKASHGCVRVSPFATADCPINSYWLWTHLPYHTRVIILDD